MNRLMSCFGVMVVTTTVAAIVWFGLGYAVGVKSAVHPTTRQDLRLQAAAWSPVGIRVRWCVKQGSCE